MSKDHETYMMTEVAPDDMMFMLHYNYPLDDSDSKCAHVKDGVIPRVISVLHYHLCAECLMEAINAHKI